MNHGLITAINARVKPEDTVVHVGDFCCKGNEKGVSGTRTKAREWQQQLNGTWIYITGNHDPNNGLKFTVDAMIVEVGHFKAFVQHRPIERACEVPDFCHFVVCGHIHEKWQEQKIDGIWNINVGVDARKYMPIDDSELVGIYTRALRKIANE